MVDRQALGRWGEDVAARHLQERGLEVLYRNWRCAQGELDLVVREGTTIAFVEVKARSGVGYGEPAEAVSRVKARRIHGLAARWLGEKRPRGSHDLRFDVVSVLRTPQGPEVVHLRGAF